MGEATRRASTGDCDGGGGGWNPFTLCFIDESRVGMGGGGVGDFFSTRGEMGGAFSLGAAIG